MVKTCKDLEFFKVFLPEFSSHELMIPPSFIDILEEPLPNKALLLDEIGQIWIVETKTEETFRVLFKKGWKNFANDHSLEFGDFLVFNYDGYSRFTVTIFANDGCKKYLGVDTTMERSRVDKEPVVKPVDLVSKPEHWEDCGKRVNRNKKHVLVNEELSVLVKDEPETEPEHLGNTRRKDKRIRDPIMSRLHEKKRRGFEEPVYKPENPHFVRTITHASLYRMEIPQTFLKSNGVELEENIELCDINGKKWTFKVMKLDRAIKLSNESWLCFCKTHKLMKKNKCLFEFIVGSNGRCNEIHVRIFRGRLLTSITRSGYQVVAM